MTALRIANVSKVFQDQSIRHLIYGVGHPPLEKLPKGCEVVEGFRPADIDVACIRFHAVGKINSYVRFFTGFKPDLEKHYASIERMQHEGVTLDIIVTPDPGDITYGNPTDKTCGYLDDFRAIMRSVHSDRPPPDIPENVPQFLLAHSISAQTLIRNLFEKGFAESLQEYAGILLFDPHLSPSKLKRIALNAFSSLCPGVRVDRAEPEPGALCLYPLTLRHAAYLTTGGDEILNRLRKEDIPIAAKNLPILVLSAKNDPVSSSEPAKAVADYINARFVELNAETHNLFTESQAGLNFMIRAMRVKARQQHNGMRSVPTRAERTAPKERSIFTPAPSFMQPSAG